MEHAQGWYESDAYRAIRHLRIEHTEGDVLLVQGVQTATKALISLANCPGSSDNSFKLTPLRCTA